MGGGDFMANALNGDYDGTVVTVFSPAVDEDERKFNEAMARFEDGYGVQKFFPAEASGGANFLKSLAGPLPHIDFMPTGGVKPHNALDYLNLPNVIAAGGTWIASPAEMEAGDWAGIEARVREAAELGKGI